MTETETTWPAEPLAPKQLSLYEVDTCSGQTISDPVIPFVPVQLPDAVHEVAFVEDQVSITDEPATTDAALDVNATVGMTPDGVVTETEAVQLAEPPTPEQLSVYDALALNGPTTSVPDVALVPAQPPDAVHDVAPVEDQINVTEEPETTVAALDAKVTVGAAAGDAGAGLLPALPPASPPPQAASARLATNPVNIRTAIWCFTTPLPQCTGVGPRWRSASVPE